MPRQKRFMRTHLIQLNVLNDQDKTLYDQIRRWKDARVFTQKLRDAIALLVDLEAGRFDVFADLFPDGVQALHHEGAMIDRQRRDTSLEDTVLEMYAYIQDNLQPGVAPPPALPSSLSLKGDRERPTFQMQTRLADVDDDELFEQLKSSTDIEPTTFDFD